MTKYEKDRSEKLQFRKGAITRQRSILKRDNSKKDKSESDKSEKGIFENIQV